LEFKIDSLHTQKNPKNVPFEIPLFIPPAKKNLKSDKSSPKEKFTFSKKHCSSQKTRIKSSSGSTNTSRLTQTPHSPLHQNG